VIWNLSRREACQMLATASAFGWWRPWRTPRWRAQDVHRDVDGARWIAFVAFRDMTPLDLIGPLQVLRGLDSPYRIAVVAERRAPIQTDAGLEFVPQMTFAEMPHPKVVIVPGGRGSVAAMGDEVIQRYLITAAATAHVVGSVCTGALVLAAAGLLEGRRASTHWAYASELEKLGARYVRARCTEDGKFITSAGVSAGIDMAIELAGRLAGREVAERIQLGLEYDPHPPFGGIDWQRVGPNELARQRQGGTGSRLAQASQLLAHRPDLLRKLGVPLP
jgi:transcriptional regulator GlxA family with amidase domain